MTGLNSSLGLACLGAAMPGEVGLGEGPETGMEA